MGRFPRFPSLPKSFGMPGRARECSLALKDLHPLFHVVLADKGTPGDLSPSIRSQAGDGQRPGRLESEFEYWLSHSAPGEA